MEKIYLTEEEKKEVLDIQTQENDYMIQLGQLEYQIQTLELQKTAIREGLLQFDSRKNTFAKQLQNKYGEGSINTETGEFTKTN